MDLKAKTDIKTVSYGAKEPHGRLEKWEYNAGPLGPDEVSVAVTHCGICHTDVALIDNDYGFSRYPVVAGHEAVGMVAALGANVDATRLRVGQRVGIGAISGACMNCEYCLGGRHNLCPRRDDTVLRGDRGGFATHVRASNWHFAYPIPDEIASEHAGPLLCAGITVFTPLLRHGVRPTDRVAVIGIGGLGHLALQFMNKWGCDVTAISSSSEKKRQAREFGARHFIDTSEPNALRNAANSFDFVLSTASGDLPWDDYVATVKPQGKLCILGGAKKPISVSMMNLLLHEKVIAGGIPGSQTETTQMLAFAARHGIKPTVETFPMTQINEAVEHVRQGKSRFRAVLVA